MSARQQEVGPNAVERHQGEDQAHQDHLDGPQVSALAERVADALADGLRQVGRSLVGRAAAVLQLLELTPKFLDLIGCLAGGVGPAGGLLIEQGFEIAAAVSASAHAFREPFLDVVEPGG